MLYIDMVFTLQAQDEGSAVPTSGRDPLFAMNFFHIYRVSKWADDVQVGKNRSVKYKVEHEMNWTSLTVLNCQTVTLRLPGIRFYLQPINKLVFQY